MWQCKISNELPKNGEFSRLKLQSALMMLLWRYRQMLADEQGIQTS